MMAEHDRLTCDEFLDLAAGVAVDAGSGEDMQRVEQHAGVCPACARALDGFREVAAVIGSTVPQLEPPHPLRSRVLEAAHASGPRDRDLRRRWVRQWRQRRWSAAWLVAAASFLFSLGALVWAAQLQGQITTLRSDAQAARDRAGRYNNMVEVLASDKLAIRPLRPVVQNMPSRGMVYMDPASGTGVLTCRQLPPLEQGHAYQVWFVRGNERVSGGLLWPDYSGNGYTLIEVPTDVQSFESVGLTDEPGTGSAWPTTPRVIGSPLTDSVE